MIRFSLGIILLFSQVVWAQEITLQTCRTRALKNNLQVKIARIDTALAEQALKGAYGIFDPFLQLDLSSSFSKNPAASQLEGAEIVTSRGQRYDLLLSQLLAYGGTISLSWTNSRTETNSFFYTLNPYYDSRLMVRIQQPLLKDFGKKRTLYQIKSLEFQNAQQKATYHQAILDLLLKVEEAYWDLKFAYENLKVKERALQVAEQHLKDTQKRIEVGIQAPIEIYQAQVGVATRKEEIITAQSAYEKAVDNLLNLMNEAITPGKTNLLPIDALTVQPFSEDLQTSFAKALKKRPEIIQLKEQKKLEELKVQLAKKDLLPSLTLNTSYGYAGLGGTAVVRDPITFDVLEVIPGGWGDAFDQIRETKYDNWSVALSLRYPIFNREGKTNKVSAELGLEKVLFQEEQLKSQVWLEIKDAYRALQTAHTSYEAARTSRIAAEKSLEAEQKKFKNGMSTSFEVLQAEQALSEARSRELQSQVNYQKSLARFHYAMGDLDTFVGIEYQD